ncbi:hypothetical protein R50073_01410 [Maricurvus nonylphenolicus]|uniref:hypothetical protein n=1 Tax=Maricurvus nonylphenolicus TaxID=1008307 RepID=UPI0036F1D6E4
MLHPDFKNGQRLDLQSCMALFLIMMGFLFYIDQGPAYSMPLTLSTIAIGVIWYVGHHAHLWWKAHHPHH